MNKVVGIGWAKTGTTTFGRCCRVLGLQHEAQRLDLVPGVVRGEPSAALEVVANRQSFDDWPWILLYREIDVAHPGSKFVLTTREPNAWLRSYRNMLQTGDHSSPRKTAIRRAIYDLPFPDVTDEALLARYERHHEEVRAYFRDRPESLLEVDWSRGDGWGELCAFLDVAVPDVPLPHANRGSYGRPSLKRWLRRLIARK